MTVAVFAAALLIPTSALSQPSCVDRGRVVEHLAKTYGEAPTAMGLANNGGVIEVFSSKSGETWTILITMPNGLSCTVAAGEHWTAIPFVLKTGATM